MSYGLAYCDGPNIYLVVKTVDQSETVIIVFTNGLEFRSQSWNLIPPESPTPEEQKQKHPENLDEYLKSLKGKGQQIQKLE